MVLDTQSTPAYQEAAAPLSRTQSAPRSQSAPQSQSSATCETTLPRFAQALEGLKSLFEHGVASSYTLPPVQCSSAKELAQVERGTEREREIGGRGRGRRARAHSLSLSHARTTHSLTHSQSFSLSFSFSFSLSAPLSMYTFLWHPFLPSANGPGSGGI
jgi:hypothetical protein